jgi:hypothetical protein
MESLTKAVLMGWKELCTGDDIDTWDCWSIHMLP